MNATDVRVVMYNVGFGDCFLVEFPTPSETPFRVLVDCGVHNAGRRPGDWTMERTVAQIVERLGVDPHLDVVVATHRHQDHVSGFTSEQWAAVHVGEVWMPWTEGPTEDAQAIATGQVDAAERLHAALDRERALADSSELRGLVGLVGNSRPNARAMATLHEGFAGAARRRFLAVEDETVIRPDGCPGLAVHVLGPSRDPAVRRLMDPPGDERYLWRGGLLGAPRNSASASAPAAPNDVANRLPFDQRFAVPRERYAQAWGHLVPDKDSIGACAWSPDTVLDVAARLDHAVNNTSVMLAFELGDAVLLFPGDAQWGIWKSVLGRPAHRELLARTTFLKVGHHGSHNATPRAFLDGLVSDGQLDAAAVSVQRISQWPEIPRRPLLDTLARRAHAVYCSSDPGHADQDSLEIAVPITAPVDAPVTETTA